MTADTEDKHVPQCALTIKTVSFLTLDVQDFVAGRIYGSLGTTAAEVRWLSSTPPVPKLFSEIVATIFNAQNAVTTIDGNFWDLPCFQGLACRRVALYKPQERKNIPIQAILRLAVVFVAWAGPVTIQNAPVSHHNHSQERSAGPSIHLAASGCQFCCGQV